MYESISGTAGTGAGFERAGLIGSISSYGALFPDDGSGATAAGLELGHLIYHQLQL